jgi:addiction module HigA family antidote
MLLLEFLEPAGMTQMELSRQIQVSYPRVNQVVQGRRAITPDTALRLSALFGTTPEFWLNGQMLWDLWHARRSDTARVLEEIKPLSVPKATP